MYEVPQIGLLTTWMIRSSQLIVVARTWKSNPRSSSFILAAPERQTCQPVFAADGFLCWLPLLRRKNSRFARKFRADDFASDCARSNSHIRVIADALVLTRIVSSLNVELVIPFRKPYRRVDRGSVFAERYQANVFLTLNFFWNRHSANLS